MSVEQPNNESRGLECPKCGCCDFRVYYTRDGLNIIKRSRICRNCGKRTISHERFISRRQKSPPEENE